MLLRALRKALAMPRGNFMRACCCFAGSGVAFFVDCTSRLGLLREKDLSGKRRPSGTGRRDAAPRRAQQQAYRRRIVVVSCSSSYSDPARIACVPHTRVYY